MVMNMNSLDLFIKVADKMSITEVSKELFISQPAVSKAITGLENQLNIKLFIRDKRNGLLLTEVGKEILILARQMKGIEDKIYQVASQEQNLLRGKIKVGSFPAASTNILPRTIALFRLKYPQVHIELAEGTSNQIKTWVEERKVDIGIVASPFETFEYQVLDHDDMVAILPDMHPLIVEDTIDLKKYQDDLIFCKGGHEAAISEAFDKYQMKLIDRLTVQSADTLIHMVENNLGIGMISRFTLSSVAHRLHVRKIRPEVKRQVGVIAVSFDELTPAAKEFVNVMKNLFKSDAAQL